MEVEAALTNFGFNQLESMVYCELLRQSPATGYRLAQRLGRIPSNVYQALKALMQKGAVLIESDAAESTSYVPVPPQQLVAALRSGFLKRADDALALLSCVHQPARQETVSQLQTAAQVLERARSMLNNARETVIYDVMPDIQDLLRPEFDAARSRGILISGIAYRDADVAPTVPFRGEAPERVKTRWPGLGLLLVTDGSEQLIAQISSDMTRVLNAVYSDSRFLSCIMHGLLHSDIRLVELRTGNDGRLPPSALEAFALQTARPPGLRALFDD